MMRIGIFSLMAMFSVAVAQEEAVDSEVSAEDEYLEWAIEFDASLDRKVGEVTLAQNAVTVNVPDGYYFLDAEDSNRVLTEAWGNPEDGTVLGMVFPAMYSPVDQEAWGVALSYEKNGYVSDEDAEKINYDELLRDMQRATHEENKWRTENGYAAITLNGWADEPSYNAATHKMYWAKSLTFEGVDVETLNYNVRVLGRRGVFNANFIATMDQLDEIRTSSVAVMDMIEFTDGNRYADYQAGDARAAYGLAGLVAGTAIAKKTGLIAVILLVLKKFWFIIAAAFLGIFRLVTRLFGGRD